jgi:hypothetical protein
MNQQLEYFIKKFNEIPDEKWMINQFYREKRQSLKLLGLTIPLLKLNKTRCCAQGHCVEKGKLREFASDIAFYGYHKGVLRYPEVFELYRITQSPEDGDKITIGLVNNGDHPKYNQPTPKARVIAYLNDLLLKQ